MRKFSFLGFAGFLLVLTMMPGAASAGVATAGAVLLDPFDPVPEIQFRHYGGYGDFDGCDSGCGGYDNTSGYGCGSRCGGYDRCSSGCHRYRHPRCGDGCRHRDDCDRCRDSGGEHGDRDGDRSGGDGGDRDGDRGGDRNAGPGSGDAHPCTQPRCYDAEHYERRWRDGDHVGEEWFDRGRKEKTIDDSGRSHGYYNHGEDWHDDEEDPPPPPPPPATPPPGK